MSQLFTDEESVVIVEAVSIHQTYLDSNGIIHDLAIEAITDYECCGVCGFDHAYEPNEAQAVHDNLDRQDIDSHERF